MRKITSAIKSITSLLNGFVFIFSHPQLWLFSIVPIVINTIVYITVVIGIISLGDNFIDSNLLNKLPASYVFLEYVFGVLWLMLGLLISYIIFINLALTLGSPFYGYIAEYTMKYYGLKFPNQTENWLQQAVFDLKRAISFESKKILLGVIVLLVSLPINAIPFIGSILYVLLNLVFNSSMTALDFYDCALERFQFPFRKKLNYIKANYYSTIPFGFVAFTLTSIPIINLLVMPALVVAAIINYKDNA